jgi:hypothetical protein
MRCHSLLRFAPRTPILRIAEAVATKFPLPVPCADFRGHADSA